MPSPTRSSNIDIPQQSTKDRSLSETFDALSVDSKQVILTMCGGARPTTSVPPRPPTPTYRFRSDSVDMSPVTKSLLQFHGIIKKSK